jgi:hypothetical protein
MAKFFRPSTIKNIDTTFLKNRALLYIILLLSLGNVYYMMVENNITFLIIFIIVGFLTSFFSKNMVVILSVSMAFTHVLRFGTNVYKLEGFENEDYTMEEEEEEEKKNQDIQYGGEDYDQQNGVSEDEQYSDSTEGIEGMKIKSKETYKGKDTFKGKDTSKDKDTFKSKDTKENMSNEFDLNSLMPSIQDNTKIQKQILEKLSGIEKFTNGLNEYIS